MDKWKEEERVTTKNIFQAGIGTNGMTQDPTDSPS